MAEIRNREDVLRALAKKYEESPSGWSVQVRENMSGYSDFLISTADELWQLKVDSLYKPDAKALGMRVGGRREARRVASNSRPAFGFRSLPADILERFLGGEFEREELNRIIERVLLEKPVRASEIDSPAMLQGPIRFGWKGHISKKQELLDLKLKRSLDKLLFGEGLGLGYA